MSTLDQWTATVCADLGLDPAAADTMTVLDLARDVAHGVARPAAPLTAYLVGVAVGRGLALPDAAGRISALAASWPRETQEPQETREPAESGAPDKDQLPERWRSRRCPRSRRRPLQVGQPGYRTLTGPNTQAAMPSSGAMSGSGGMHSSPRSATPGSARRGASRAAKGKPKKGAMGANVTGTVLGAAAEIPVSGGKIYTTAKVVVTQPARGQYEAFSAMCTHVGCIMSAVANGTIDCPCHGSQFKITNGAVVTGPAPSPLPRKQIKIVN